MPASNSRMIEKARSLAVDEIVLDLEDAVAPDDKECAREGLPEAIEILSPDHRVAVRINAVSTEWGAADLAAIANCATAPDSIVVPKVEEPADLADCRTALPGLDEIGLQALIETALGVEGLTAIASADCGVESLVLGYADLAASLGRPAAAIDDMSLWAAIQDRVVIGARAHGLAAIDGPFLRLDEDAALRNASRVARMRGFDGKWTIHPAQVGPVTAVFTPDPDTIAEAHALLDALEDAEAGGVGSALHAGAMIDEALRKSALLVLARAGEDR